MNEPKEIRLKPYDKFKPTDILLLGEFKFAVTILLSAFAFARYAMMPDRIHELCLIAMLCSTLGDLCMMNHRGLPALTFKGKQFYAGMLSFAFAHVFYRQMFRSILTEPIAWGLGETVCFLWLLAFLVIMNLCELKKSSAVFNLATGLYTGFIFANLASAINCAYYENGKYIAAFVGVLFFIISDFFLLLRETYKDTTTIRKLIWFFYPLAQILIIGNV